LQHQQALAGQAKDVQFAVGGDVVDAGITGCAKPTALGYSALNAG
jgi:hypothetical protein